MENVNAMLDIHYGNNLADNALVTQNQVLMDQLVLVTLIMFLTLKIIPAIVDVMFPKTGLTIGVSVKVDTYHGNKAVDNVHLVLHLIVKRLHVFVQIIKFISMIQTFVEIVQLDLFQILIEVIAFVQQEQNLLMECAQNNVKLTKNL